jgi:hypothetical protein
MASAVFSITAAEMQAKITPSEGEYEFSIGSGGDLESAALDEIVNQCEHEVLGYLKLKYQQLVRRVDGEVAVRSAAGGETVLQAGLFPVTAGTLKVYINFPSRKAWRERQPRHALPAGEYSVDNATGAVTLVNALAEGDSAWLAYEHGAAAKLLDLRKDTMNLAAAEIARRFAYFRSASGFERFENWEIAARQHLRDLGRNEGQTIEMFERLALVMETRSHSIADILG